jgi:hypothetical protein
MSDDDTLRGRAPAGAIIEAILQEIRSSLAGRPANAHTRALLAKAESYARVMDRWAVIPPNDAQQGALLDLVEELRAQVENEEPPSSRRLARMSLKSSPSD